MRWWYGWIIGLLLSGLVGCREASPGPTPATGEGEEAAAFRLSSPAFGHGQPIPKRYTCEGEDLIPPLQWEGAPPGTQSFVLIMEDPDAPMGTWDHWIVYDIPATVTSIREATPPPGRVGRNSWEKTSYGGPCPPPGPVHRYFFRLYAVDIPSLNLPEGAEKKDVLQALEGHILAQTELMGLYQR